MSRSATETDRKKRQLPATKPARPAAPQLAGERQDLGALLRPPAGSIAVGARSDRAEVEADRVAEAVLKDSPRERRDKTKPEGERKEGEEPDLPAAQARGPPWPVLAVDNDKPQGAAPGMGHDLPHGAAVSGLRQATAAHVQPFCVQQTPLFCVQRTTAQGGQPNTDSLAAVPALPGNQSEVSVSGKEESDLDEFAAGDFQALAEGQAVQPKFLPGHGAGFALAAPLAARIRGARGGGTLPAPLRARLEARLGVDLSGLRLHQGAEAMALCQAIGARAFAYGAGIWLRSPADRADPRLLAHEVVHTIQQRAVPRRVRRGDPGRQSRPADRQPADRRRPELLPRQPRGPPVPAPVAAHAPALRRLADDQADTGMLARGAEQLADRLDSYQVMKVVTGRRLFTRETVTASAADYVGAFMRFIGAQDTFEQMKQSGALERGFAEIRTGLVRHDITWERVRTTFARAADEFDWLSPVASFRAIFLPFFNDLLAFGGTVLRVIAELVAEAFVIGFGPMGRQVWEKIRGIGDTIQLIVADPMRFAQNLIRAVARGIQGFGERIWEHIKAGLLAWVLGPLTEMGVQLPARLDLKGVISVILQVMGLTYPQLRPRIVRALDPHGEVKVGVVERLIEAVAILRSEGLAGLWRKLLDYVQNLQTTVLNGIRDWVVRAAVQAGIRKLVAWSNPAGALIDILLTIYNLIVFFVERLQQILDFAASVFDSLGKIARGQLSDAANAVEASMARTIPIIISFLVRLLGLPDIGGTIRRIITNLRARVHAAFDRLLNWVVSKVKKLIARLVERFRRGNPPRRATFAMDGRQHQLWAEDAGGRIAVMMASDNPQPLRREDAAQSAREFEASADHSLSESGAGIARVAPAADALLDEQERLNRLGEPNRATPAARAGLEQKATALGTALGEAARRPPAAAEVDDHSPEQVDAPRGEAALDRTAYPMRRRIRTTIKVEGAAGDWAAMSEVYNRAKAEAPDPADVYANLERDHIAEFALLARVSRIAVPGVMRAGAAGRNWLFPQLREAVRNPSTDAKPANPLLPVLIVRRRINNQIGASSAKFAAWAAGFRQDGEAWLPKRFDAPMDDPQRQAAMAELQAGYGAQALIEDMQSHLDAVTRAYAGLPQGTIEADLVDHVNTRATPILQQILRSIFGGTAGPPPQAEGAQAGINLPYDDELAENELEMAPYATLAQSRPVGAHMERHHLLEKNIVQKLRDRAEGLTLGGLLGADGIEQLVAARMQAAEAGLGAEAKTALAGDPARQAAMAGVRQALSGAFDGLALSCGMKTGQDVQDNGIAINVLSSINRQAATQPDSNVDAALQAVPAALRGMAEPLLARATAAPLGEAVHQLAEGGTPDPGGLGGQLAAAAQQQAGTLNTTLGRSWRTAFADLTGNAYATFKGLQAASIAELQASGDPPAIRRAAGMQARHGALTRQRLTEANLAAWFQAP